MTCPVSWLDNWEQFGCPLIFTSIVKSFFQVLLVIVMNQKLYSRKLDPSFQDSLSVGSGSSPTSWVYKTIRNPADWLKINGCQLVDACFLLLLEEMPSVEIQGFHPAAVNVKLLVEFYPRLRGFNNCNFIDRSSCLLCWHSGFFKEPPPDSINTLISVMWIDIKS